MTRCALLIVVQPQIVLTATTIITSSSSLSCTFVISFFYDKKDCHEYIFAFSLSVSKVYKCVNPQIDNFLDRRNFFDNMAKLSLNDIEEGNARCVCAVLRVAKS